MSQRNPLNERYTTDEHKGQTRKSAASAKPKAKAAASVRVESMQKTKQQVKAEKRAARAKQAELDRKYYNPPTEQYKRLRRLWWTLLIVAIVMLLGSWILQRTVGSSLVSFILLGLSYVCIIVALYVELSKIRKARREYQAQMEAHKSKAVRAAEKEAKAQQRAAAEAAKNNSKDSK